ncbi:MAG TPA: SDR family NAD(P)-dependent oxidoreductase, partial [Polyangium sp.]|nr:SDR family NAD(P)-dependent oxidoreductase [Polyangium sp.]
MKLEGRSVLITGGGTGIGLALGRALVGAGAKVLLCGRREGPLREAAAELPGLAWTVADVADPASRADLVRWALTTAPDLDMLVNNAGVLRRIALLDGAAALEGVDELAVNLVAPIHLTAALLPHLRTRSPGAVVNIGSILGFVPLAEAPIYSASKAALHVFTQGLRHQLRDTSVRVFEVIPPAVDTEPNAGATGAERKRLIPPEAVA